MTRGQLLEERLDPLLPEGWKQGRAQAGPEHRLVDRLDELDEGTGFPDVTEIAALAA